MQESKKIIKNTFLLYYSLIVNILVGIFYSRIILINLGIEDFGIYSLISGLIIMLSFLKSSMSGSLQKFISCALKDDANQNKTQVKQIFSAALIIHLLIALIVLILSETILFYLFSHHLNIPNNRLSAAEWIFHTITFSFVCNISSVPAQAMLISYEKFKELSLLQLITPTGQLLAAITIGLFSYDKLKLFAFIMFLISLGEFITYYYIAKKSCSGFGFIFIRDSKIYHEITNFAGWGLFGEISSILKNQGTAIILNIFFGPIANAAYGISNQIRGKTSEVSMLIGKSSSPQIIKNFSGNNPKQALKLVNQASKISFSLLYIIVFPIIVETPTITRIWLKIIPNYTIYFIQLALIGALIETFSYPLMTLSRATGKIKLYQMMVGGLLLFNLPISYYYLYKGFPPYTIYLISITLSIIALFLRLIILQKTANLSLTFFSKHVFIKSFLFVLISLGLYLLIKILPCYYVLEKILIIIGIPLILFWFFLFVILSKHEKEILFSTFHLKNKNYAK